MCAARPLGSNLICHNRGGHREEFALPAPWICVGHSGGKHHPSLFSQHRPLTSTNPQGTRMAPSDGLKRKVQSVLTRDLVQDHYRTGHGRFDGFAYVATEVYFYLAGGYDAGLQPMELALGGKKHRWLIDRHSRVIDLSFAPGETSTFPYHLGRGCRFRWAPGISRPAQLIVARVRTHPR
jgi:hypothetical protein